MSDEKMTRSTQSMTWVFNSLEHNSGVIRNGEKITAIAAAIADGWHEPIATFWRLVGDKGDGLTESWEHFHRRIGNPTFQCVFLVSLKARKTDTTEVLTELVQYAKHGNHATAFPSHIVNLYNVITASYHYGSRRSLIVWRTAYHLDCAIKKIDGIQNHREPIVAESWSLASGGNLDRFSTT